MADVDGSEEASTEAKIPAVGDGTAPESIPESVPEGPTSNKNGVQSNGDNESGETKENYGNEAGKSDPQPSTEAAQTSKLEIETNPKEEEEIPTAIVFSSTESWAKMLKSPKIPEFSPSLNPNRPGSLHGLGLRLALERSKSTGMFCRDVHNFIVGVATIYDNYGTNLNKVSQYIRPGRLPFDGDCVLDDDFKALYECMKHFGDRFRTLAGFFRSTIAVSLKQTLSDTSKTVEFCSDRYQRVRTDSFQSRQSANTLFKKYANAVQAAEAEIQVWMKAIDDNGEEGESKTESGSAETAGTPEMTPWETALTRLGKNNPDGTARLVRKLKAVQSTQAEYADAVHKENNKVSLSEEMEVVGLEKIQESEQDRISLLATSVVTKVFLGEIDMETKNLPTPSSFDESTFAEGFEKKGMDLLAGLNAGLFKQQSLPYEPGMGKMEAETMGIPSEFGKLRDDVKTCFANHEKRIKATQTIYKLLEEVEELAGQSASSLTSRTQAQVGNQTGSAIGSRSSHLWIETVNTFQYEAKLISDVAFACKKLRNSKVESWMANAPRTLKNEIDLDDAAWKLVSDSTRAEMKSESRYKQSKDQAEKARSRASSRGDLSSGSNDSSERPASSNVDNSATDAPNSPFRLFKGRGEALKLLQEKALGQIPDDQREEKDKSAYEEAAAAKKDALMSYKAYTTTRIQKLESQDKVGWEELKAIIDEIQKTISILKEARQETLRTKVIEETKSSFPRLPSDLDDWMETVKERILQKEKASSTGGANEVKYLLSIQSIETENVKKLLSLTEDDDEMPIESLEKTESRSPLQSLSVRSATSFDSGADSTVQSSKASVAGDSAKPTIAKSASEVSGNASASLQQSAMKQVSSREQNIQAFAKKFWSKKSEDEKLPEILEIFACSYRPKEKTAFLTPNLHGRCFTTSEKLHFLSWDNKSFDLKWNQIKSVEKEKGFMGSASDNSLAVTYTSDGSDSAFTLSRLDASDKILAHLQSLLDAKKPKERTVADRADPPGNSLPPVPQDALLKDMEIVVSKNIKGTNIKSVFEKCWADPKGQKSFYGAWLEDEECFDITMGEWEYAEKGASFKNPWCGQKGETYTQKRLVTFKFKRTTHLYIGPPIAVVNQWHYVRVEGDDKIVLAIEATFEGIPYSDTFGVEMRWVARRIGSNEVKVEVGLFVLFKKRTMLQSQIKAGTISETKNVHVRLFNAVKKACTVPGESTREGAEEEEEEEEETEVTKTEERGLIGKLADIIPGNPSSAVAVIAAIFVGRYLMTSILGAGGQAGVVRLEMQVGQLQEEVRALRESVDLLVDILNKKGRL